MMLVSVRLGANIEHFIYDSCVDYRFLYVSQSAGLVLECNGIVLIADISGVGVNSVLLALLVRPSLFNFINAW